MQEPTHILAGAVIHRAFLPLRPRWLGLALTAGCAFLSHGLLDRLANATYHPPQANFHDPFWVVFHTAVLVSTIWFLILFWRRQWVGVLFAMLPDFDWVIIHGQKIFGLHLSFYQRPHMHDWLGPVFAWVKVPRLRDHPWACLVEIALIAALWVVFRRLANRGQTPAPA